MPVSASNGEASTLKIGYALLIFDQCDMADEPYLLRSYQNFFVKHLDFGPQTIENTRFFILAYLKCYFSQNVEKRLTIHKLS